MLVVRLAEHAKKGCTNELVELLTSLPDYAPAPPHGWRIYWHTQFSPWNVVVFEAEFESLAEHEAWWKESWAAPRFREWFDKKSELTERSGGGELWSMKVLK